MFEARAAHTATLLPNGSVLIADGCNTIYDSSLVYGLGPTNSIYYSEVYDPTTGTFHPVGQILQGRVGWTASRATEFKDAQGPGRG